MLQLLDKFTPAPAEFPKELQSSYEAADSDWLHSLGDTVANALGARPASNTHHWSKPVRCPHHDDQHASASWNFECAALNCFVCGWHGAIETAEKLGIPHTAPTAQHLLRPQLPTEAQRALTKLGLTSVARAIDALYQHGYKPGDAVTYKDIRQVTGCGTKTAYQVLRASVSQANGSNDTDNGESVFSVCLTIQ